MKKTAPLALLFLATATGLGLSTTLGAQKALDERRHVDLAICLDTSGSMRGLLDSARQSIWAIVNDLALAKPAPRLRIALLTFGNDGHSKANGWVRVDTGFTGDLDLVSEKLFALKTNGGTELVGRVLQASLEQLRWTSSSNALKLIVVAGNESADQDKMVDFRSQCKKAISRGIMINSIYCGNPGDQLAPVWNMVAKLADGHFDTINQHGTVALQSPFDAQITSLSAALNTTYIPLGADGARGNRNQIVQDGNASHLNSQASAQRCQAKASGNYYCSWDLVDNLRTKKLKISEVKVTDLPENMRKMTMKERVAYVAEMQKKRTDIQKKVIDLTAKRSAWCTQELEKRRDGKGTSFESAVRKSVRAQAEAKGLKYPSKKKPAKAKTTDKKPGAQPKPRSK
jgi:hypothetical protein